MKDKTMVIICVMITIATVLYACTFRNVIAHPGGEWLIGGVIYIAYYLIRSGIQDVRGAKRKG